MLKRDPMTRLSGFMLVAGRGLRTMPAHVAAEVSPRSGTHAMIATEQRLATLAGLDVLRRGGNAVDAAVAIGYALAVVDPCCGNIGGGGFMLVRMHDGRERFIDFREKAPLRATPRHVSGCAAGTSIADAFPKGWLAIGVPGTVMGMDRALERVRNDAARDVMASAIALARDGFMLEAGDLLPLSVRRAKDTAARIVCASSERARDLDADGRYPERAIASCSRNLARTLASYRRRTAPRHFTAGRSRERSSPRAERNGGILTLDDFRRYTVDESQPLHCTYRGYDVVSAPPPSSGGVTLCEILNDRSPRIRLRDGDGIARAKTHYVIEAERRAYADRNADLGDPAFVSNPVAQLLDPSIRGEVSCDDRSDRERRRRRT